MRLGVLALLVCWVGVAMAEPLGATVRGRVTDVLGRPVANARVYVLDRARVPTPTTTDKDGRYSLVVATAGTHGVVIATDKARVFRQVLVEPDAITTLDISLDIDTQGGEVINIEDWKRPRPAKPAEPKFDPQRPPPYSDEAVERDAWARAWFLLDVDETGRVTRLKLLKSPGFDLNQIAIETAFELRFEPARDANGLPKKSYIVWSMEWPSYSWLSQRFGTAQRMPRNITVRGRAVNASELTSDDPGPTERGFDTRQRMPGAAGLVTSQSFAAVPCAGSGPLNLDNWNLVYRDCSRPDMRAADVLPWITPQTAEAAVAELAAADRRRALQEVTPRTSKVPIIVSAGISGSLAIGLVVALRTYIKHVEASQQPFIEADVYREEMRLRDRWRNISLGLSAAVVVSSGITLFLWHRHQSRRSFSVQPTNGPGATVSLGMSF